MKKSPRIVLLTGLAVCFGLSSYLFSNHYAEESFNSVLEQRVSEFESMTTYKTTYVYDSFSFNPFSLTSTVSNLQLMVGEPQVVVLDIKKVSFDLEGTLQAKNVSAVSMFGDYPTTIASISSVDAHYFEGDLGDVGLSLNGLYASNKIYKQYFSEESLVLFDQIFSDGALSVSLDMDEVSKNSFITTAEIKTTTGFDLTANVDYGVSSSAVKGSPVVPGAIPLDKDVLVKKISFSLADKGFKDILVNWGGSLGQPSPDQNEVFQAQLYEALKVVFNETWQYPSIPVDALNGFNAFLRAGERFDFSSEFKEPVSVESVMEHVFGTPDYSIYENANVSFKVVEYE